MNKLRILTLFWQPHFIIQHDGCSCLPFCIIPVNIVATIFRSYILNVLESKSIEIIQNMKLRVSWRSTMKYYSKNSIQKYVETKYARWICDEQVMYRTASDQQKYT